MKKRRGISKAVFAILVAAASSRTSPLSAQAAPDIQFMHDMIAHHSQAIEMSALVPARSTNETIRLLAERITISQQDEIKRMQAWLSARGDTSTTSSEHSHMLMPGMLTAAELDTLRNSKGVAFDRLFLTDMTKHHEGALKMVEQLFATPRGVQDPVLWQMATNIDADQRAEIARMQVLLSNLH